MDDRPMNNPWHEQHAQAETEMQEGDAGLAQALVANEYRDAPREFPCNTPGCIGFAFYKATIGAMKCTSCGALYHTNQERI